MVRPLASPAMSVSKDRYRHIHPGLSVAVTVLAAILLAGCSTQSHDYPSPGMRKPEAAFSPSERSSDTPADPVYVPGPSTSASVDAISVAQVFAVAWAQPDLPEQAWWDGVSTYCEPGLGQRLRTTDPGTVPATRVTGTANATSSVSDRVTVEIPTDAGTLVVTVIKVDDAWLVGDIDFRRDVQ